MAVAVAVATEQPINAMAFHLGCTHAPMHLVVGHPPVPVLRSAGWMS